MITLVIFLLFLPVTCFAKYYSIIDASINCAVQKDSKIRWEEKRTFSFQGDYTFGYYDLPMIGYDWFREIVVLENSKAYDFNESQKPGSYWVEHLDTYHRIHFYYHAINEKRTFEYRYVIEGAVKVYEDYGQFYWKLQGDRWGEGVDNFTATIHLEQSIPLDLYKVWVHGPLNGVVSKVDDKTIFVEAKNVPANTFVEIRLLIPSTYFTDGKKETGLIGPLALKEEAVWVKEANDIRFQEIRQERVRKFWKWFWDILVYGLALYLFLYVIYLYLKFGREYVLPKKYDYVREPPEDIPPAEVGYLMKFNRFHPYTIQAILLDLIRRKYIRTEEGDGKDYRQGEIVLIKEDSKGLNPLKDYELTFLMEILFRDASNVNQAKTTTRILQKAIRTSPYHFYSPIEKFKKELASSVKEQNFFDQVSAEKAEWVIALSSIMLVVFLLFGVFIPHSSLLLFLIPFYWIVGNKAIARRTLKGKEVHDRSLAFKRFLQDFSQLNAYEADSIVIWEKFLVYAVILGVSKKVIEALQVKWNVLPDHTQSNLFVSSDTAWMHSITRLSASSLSLGSSIGHLSRPSARTYSSSGSSFHFSSYSGGGGGFSGGGGGGGGGSGGGMG